MKKIYIVILHFGFTSITQSCINSLKKFETYPYKIIIVNNMQGILRSKDFLSKNIKVINNKENKGFSGGVNVGISYALSQSADAILLLNNDTKIVKPFLGNLVDILFSKKDIGIVGPAIKFRKDANFIYDTGGYLTWFGKTYHKEPSSLDGQTTHEIPYMTGAAMLIKKQVFEKIGLFDDAFFLYYEDVDFCLRAGKNGFKVFIDTAVYITHSLSKTAGKMSALAVYHQTRSAIIFEKIHVKGILRKTVHKLFLLYQSTLFTLKAPQAGLAAWKAIFTSS